MSATRVCSWLACPNWYDAIIGGPGPGWRRWNTLGLLLCPDHAPIWDDETHAPSLDIADPNRPVMHCACTWHIDATELNAAKVAEAYLLHLHTAIATASTDPASGQE